MRPLSSILLVASLLWSVGCGDSLLGNASLDLVLDPVPPPADPSLSVRWFGGVDDGTVVPCERQATVITSTVDSLFDGLELRVPRPPAPTPSVWAEGPGYRYAIGVVLLHDGPDRSAPGFPLRSVWGVVDERVVLVAEGDLEAVQARLELGPPADPRRLVDGPQWMTVNPERALPSNWIGGLWFDDDGPDDNELSVWHRSIVNIEVAGQVAGRGAGGLHFGSCSR